MSDITVKIKVNPRKASRKTSIVVLEIFLIIAAILFIYPTIFVLINAFKSSAEIVTNPIGLPIKWTMENFVTVLTAKGSGGVTFFSALVNTMVLCIGSVLGVLLFSSMAAYKLVRTKSRLATGLFYLFAFFMVIPFQIIMVPLVVLSLDLGFKDHLGLILMYWGLGAPTAVFMFHGFIKGVPLSLEESASIDGAGPLRTFFQIVFPLLAPVTTTLAIFNILWVWNDFLLPNIILRKGTLVLFQFNFFTSYTADYGALTASLVMTATPVVLFYIFLQKYIVKGVTAGAVKG